MLMGAANESRPVTHTQYVTVQHVNVLDQLWVLHKYKHNEGTRVIHWNERNTLNLKKL